MMGLVGENRRRNANQSQATFGKVRAQEIRHTAGLVRAGGKWLVVVSWPGSGTLLVRKRG